MHEYEVLTNFSVPNNSVERTFPTRKLGGIHEKNESIPTRKYLGTKVIS